MLGSKLSDTLIKTGKKMKSNEKPFEKERDQRLVGKLIYLSHTRLDIIFVVNVVSRYMHFLKEVHLKVVYKILRYIKNSPRKGLIL